jgi:hypothetical protein
MIIALLALILLVLLLMGGPTLKTRLSILTVRLLVLAAAVAGYVLMFPGGIK